MSTETAAAQADTPTAAATPEQATPAARVIYESHAEDGAGEKADADDGAAKTTAETGKDAGEGKTPAADKKAEAESEETRTQARRRQRREAMERIAQSEAAAKAEADRLRKQIEALKPKDPLEADDYEAAIAENAANAVFRRQNETSLQDADNRAKAAKQEAVAARAAAWTEEVAELGHIADLKAKIEDPDFKITTDTAALVMDDAVIERGPELAYYLANNPQALAQIEALPLHQRAAQLVRLEAKLPALSRKTTSSAPEPLDRVSGKNASTGIDLETASFADYKRARGLD